MSSFGRRRKQRIVAVDLRDIAGDVVNSVPETEDFGHDAFVRSRRNLAVRLEAPKGGKE